jgi:hypothetical protein
VLCSNNRVVRFPNPALGILVFGATLAVADMMPTLLIKGLVNFADLIIVGKVERVQQTASGDITYSGIIRAGTIRRI